MPRKPLKKGPHSVTTSKSVKTHEHKDFDRKLGKFFTKVNRVIEDARSKMSPEERERADRAADAIVESAISGGGRSRNTA